MKTQIDQSKIKILAFDLDETLLTDIKQIGDKTKDALKRAVEAGYLPVISTGRGLSTVPGEVIGTGYFRYAVTANGARVTDLKTGELVCSAFLTEEALKPAMKYIEDEEVRPELFVDNRVYADKYLLDNFEMFGVLDAVSQHYIAATRTALEHSELFELIRASMGRIENINIFFVDPAKRLRYFDELLKIPTITTVTSMPYNLEIGARNASKGLALTALAEKLGMDASAVMAFGDSNNDASMIKAAGIGVAMANADPKLKELADVITLSNLEEGCAYIINKMLAGEPLR